MLPETLRKVRVGEVMSPKANQVCMILLQGLNCTLTVVPACSTAQFVLSKSIMLDRMHGNGPAYAQCAAVCVVSSLFPKKKTLKPHKLALRTSATQRAILAELHKSMP